MVVSAMMDPITNAPSSAEKPAFTAIRTIPRHSPIDKTSRISSSIKGFNFLSKVGNRKIPSRNHRIRKNSSLATVNRICVPSNSLVTAMVESNTMRRITTISSTTRTPNTIFAKFFVFTPNSSNARMIIVVEELASIPPRNILSMVLQPSMRPV